VCDDVAVAAGPADVVVFTVPAPALRDAARRFGDVARGDHLVLHACRGVEEGFVLPHEVLRAETCVRKVGVLGGPLHAADLSSERVLAAVVASRYDEVTRAARALCAATSVRVHATQDVVGVEVAGAVSNVAAIAAGMADGLALGETAHGILLAHGLADATRLGVALGAAAATFRGLAGVGDLIPRRVTSTQRHAEVGARLGRGAAPADALHATSGPLEGVVTAASAAARARALGLRLPLVEAVADVLAGTRAPRDAIEGVLACDLAL
jgi:glycerol-3-phosphate dehydrogenase (NAD(P)+)